MYKLTENGIIRISDNIFIPLDTTNRHYQEYLQWLKQGNQPIPEYVPIECINKATYEVDNECVTTKLKNKLLQELNNITQKYIDDVFKALDEDMSDIATELDRLKSYIKYWLVKGKIDENAEINFTIDDLYLLAARFIAGEITLDQIYTAIDSLQLINEAKQNIKSKIPRIAEIVKLIELKEKIWDTESIIESQLQQLADLDSILNYNIQDNCLPQYIQLTKTFYTNNKQIDEMINSYYAKYIPEQENNEQNEEV